MYKRKVRASVLRQHGMSRAAWFRMKHYVCSESGIVINPVNLGDVHRLLGIFERSESGRAWLLKNDPDHVARMDRDARDRGGRKR